jgi:hypothetical protein
MYGSIARHSILIAAAEGEGLGKKHTPLAKREWRVFLATLRPSQTKYA